jgi:hypothetical protein
MASEQIHATAFGAAGLGLPGVMWGLDRMKVELPTRIVVAVLIISAIFVLISIGLWIHLLLKRFIPEISWRFSSARVPLHRAATMAYEAAEKAGVLHLHVGSNELPEKRLWHFKLLLLVHDKTQLFGIKPPSTKSNPIPKSELIGHDNYPMEGGQIGPAIPLNADPTYIDVMVGSKGLRLVIKEIRAEGKS